MISFTLQPIRFAYLHRSFSMIQFSITFIMVVFQLPRRRYILKLYDIFLFSPVRHFSYSFSPQVYDAAQRAAIHDTIMNFPDKYSTVVGERGLKVRSYCCWQIQNVLHSCILMGSIYAPFGTRRALNFLMLTGFSLALNMCNSQMYMVACCYKLNKLWSTKVSTSGYT